MLIMLVMFTCLGLSVAIHFTMMIGDIFHEFKEIMGGSDLCFVWTVLIPTFILPVFVAIPLDSPLSATYFGTSKNGNVATFLYQPDEGPNQKEKAWTGEYDVEPGSCYEATIPGRFDFIVFSDYRVTELEPTACPPFEINRTIFYNYQKRACFDEFQPKSKGEL